MNNDKATSITKYVSNTACAVTPQHWPRCKRLKCLLAAAMTIAAGPVFADWTVTTQELIPIATSPLLDRFGEDVNYQFDAAYAKTVTAETIPSGSIGINNYVSSKTVSYSSSRDATWVEYQLSGMQSGTLNSQYNFSGTRPSITCRPRISATVGENTTSFERSCTVTVTMTTTVRYSPSLNTTSSTYSWYFIIKQAAGSATVTVTLDSNEGTEAQPYPSYLYVNGGKNFSFSNGPTYTFINTGYKQTTMQAPSGGVTDEQRRQYANSFVMPTTTRTGCVFDGWWTVSTFSEANNIRISDANNTPIDGVRPTAKVTAIKAHWIYEAPHNFSATRNLTDMIALSWEPIADASDTTYKIYRSQNETCPATPTFATAATSYNDTDAVAGQEYNYWIVAERPNTYSVTHSLTNTISGYREMPQVAMPSITLANGSTFTTSSTTVTLGCITDGVTIRYTTDGSEPDESSTEYLAPFTIYDTTTIKAKAFKDGMRPSETSTATIVKVIPVALGTALDTNLALATGGSGEWTGINDSTAAVGGDCIKSGQVGNRASAWISTTVSGKGTFSFWWKVSCEAGEEYDCDYAEFAAPDADVSVICRDGIMAAWEQITVVFSTDGEHELKWTYKKDKSGADGEDCLYLDGFSWTPALPVPISLAITGATSVMAGGTATYTCTVTRNDGTSGLVTPTWSITSGGAYASINSSGVLNANGIAIPQSVTIQASYTQNGTTKTATKTITINTKTVTITFNPNGGTVSPTTRSYTAYSTYGSLPSATYTGNSFAGWFTTVNGGIQITESSTVPASATTLYAHWTENPPPTPTCTESTPVPVRHDWLAKYAGIMAAAGNDYEAAAMRATGKRDGKGNALCVWHDYVAGTDPTNTNSRFTAKVEFDNGMPKVGWVPDLNESGTKSERFYKVFGKKTLAANENWTRIVTESDQKDYNFFKVTVNMEETPDTEEDLKFGDGTGNGSGANGGNERPVSLGTVQDVTASINSVNAVYISWQSVEDATGYEIWRGTELTTNGAVHIATSTETTSYADTQAATGGTYNYFVRAYSQSGLGEFSAPAVGMRLSVPETVTISFNANGGETSTFGGTYTPGNTYGTLPHASRSGYCFAGWWTEANGGTRVFSSSIVASAVTTLYAHWCGNGGVDWTIDADGTLSAVSLNGATVATIPDCVYSISNRVFSGMTKLETINIPSSVTNIGVYTFSMCYKLANINLPNSLIGLGDGAFSYCNSLTSITIPSSLTIIGFDTFYKCTGLENLTIPDSIVNIKERAFQDCTGLKSVIIGKGTRTIQGYVFDGCSSLTDIAIGDNVEEIGAAAFQGCSSLNSIRIPASVQNIGMRLFDSCSSLCSVSFEGALVSYDVYYLYDKTPQELVTYVTSKWTGPKDTWCGRSVIERN